MTLKQGAIIAGIVIVVIVAGFYWHESMLQAASAAQLDQLRKDNAAQIADILLKEAAREADLNAKIAALEKQRQQVLTPEQLVAAIAKVIPNVQPIILPTPDAGGASSSGKPALPDAPSAVLQNPDLRALYDFALTCKECDLKLEVAEQKVADRDKQVVLLSQERDQAVLAAKGGSKWKKVLGRVKDVAIGVGVGVTIGMVLK